MKTTPDGTIRYGQTITWTKFNGDKTSCGVGELQTLERAQRLAIRMALRMGWTPPRLWQWWRWKDTRVREELVQEVMGELQQVDNDHA